MNRQAFYLLRAIIHKHGLNVVSSARCCDAYLSDLMPSLPHERVLLTKAVQVGVVDELLTRPKTVQMKPLLQALVKKSGISRQDAEQVLVAWRFALASEMERVSQYQQALAANTHKSGFGLGSATALVLAAVLGGGLWTASQYNLGSELISSLSREWSFGANDSHGAVVAVDAELEAMLREAENSPLAQDIFPNEGGDNVYLEANSTVASNAVKADKSSELIKSAAMPNVREVAEGAKSAVFPSRESKSNAIRSDSTVDPTQFKQVVSNAIYALENFVSDLSSVRKKLEAQRNVQQLWRSTQQPYYQQQYGALGTQMKKLEKKLDASAIQYGQALNKLCGFYTAYGDMVDGLPSDGLYSVLRRHLRHCQASRSGYDTNRQRLAQDLQQVYRAL